MILSALRAPNATNLLLDPGPVVPVVVYTGPTRTDAEIAKLAAEPAAEPARKRVKHKAVAEHSTDGKKVAKPKEGKPAAENTDGKAIDGKATDGKAAARAPWTPLSSSALAASPPAELKAGAAAAAPAPNKPAAANFAQ